MTAGTKMLLPLGSVLLLAAAWIAYWFIASSVAQNALAKQRAAFAAKGVTLTCAAEQWSGFPFRFNWTCTKPSLSLPALRIDAAAFEAVAMAYNPWHLLGALEGPTLVEGQGPVQRVTHDPVRASLRKGSVTAEVTALAAEGYGSAERLLVSARLEGVDGDLAIDATGAYVEREEIDIPVDSASLRAHGTRGGKVSIGTLSLASGAVSVQGAGEGEVDGDGLLSGEFRAETNDIGGLLKLVAPALRMTPAEEKSARIMFASGKARLTAKAGTVYWGFVPVAKLKPINLPR